MLPVLLMEPDSCGKRRRFSDTLMSPRRAPLASLEDVKKRLREIRNDSVAHLESLRNELTSRLAAYPEVEVTFAGDAALAAETIHEISEGRPIAVSKSAVVSNELKPELVTSGFRVIETYYDQFEPFENRFAEPWQLPTIGYESVPGCFDLSRNLLTLRQTKIQNQGSKNFVGLLGVNAISAKDGAVVMLQHMHNISTVFEEAKDLILVASLDKIVEDLEDAVFMTRCMATFGWDAIPLSIHGKTTNEQAMDKRPFDIPAGQTEGKIHLIVFDNGRSRILDTPYRDLMACIGCRACIKGCPAFPFFGDANQWSPKEYIFFFATGENPSLDLCLQCKSCQANCPLDIDLPGMILEARTEAMAKRGHSLSDRFFSHVETITRWGGAVPVVSDMAARNKGLRWLGEKVLDISKERDLPRMQRRTFTKWFRSTADRNVEEK